MYFEVLFIHITIARTKRNIQICHHHKFSQMRKIRKTHHCTLFQNTDPPFSKQTPTVTMSNITPQAQVQATQKTDKTCPILKEYLDAFAIEFLAIQGIHTANELLAHGSIPVLPPAGVNKRSKSKSKSSSNIDYNNASIDDPINVVRTTSLLGTDSHLTLTLYHYRFIEKRDPKPSSKLVTKEVSFRPGWEFRSLGFERQNFNENYIRTFIICNVPNSNSSKWHN